MYAIDHSLVSVFGELTPSARSSMLRTPPWSFPQARVLYQPAFLPIELARAATPAADGNLNLLSFAGWTLGGIFVVEWTTSPFGPYREVAVLSALVSRGLSIGAWASHIFVDRSEAAEAGRSVFGLPAQLTKIRFENAHIGGPDHVRCHFAEDEVSVSGWDGWLPTERLHTTTVHAPFTVSLPSFSGWLPAQPEHLQGHTALLRYPLTLSSVRRARLQPAMTGSMSASADDKLLRGILTSLRPASPCFRVDGVDVLAGCPEILASGTESG